MSDQKDLFEIEPKSKSAGPVECLGMTFSNDEERRNHFLGILREKLKDPEFRKIEGFPIGSDEDILALSNPPYYTACPNPFIADFIKRYGKPYEPSEPYNREPFAADVSEGNKEPIYNAHTYHTKVPYKAIMRYILNYTNPGDLVFDGFCGTGMAAIAALQCGTPDPDFKKAVEEDSRKRGLAISWGSRSCIVNDLSPAATFISQNYLSESDISQYEGLLRKLVANVESELGWMYETNGPGSTYRGKVIYTVWSQVFRCPECTGEINYWEAAIDPETVKVRPRLSCPNCGANLVKRDLDRCIVKHHDTALGQIVESVKQVPVRIRYELQGRQYDKTPDMDDAAALDRIDREDISVAYPSDKIMFRDGEWGDLYRGYHQGISHVHHFFTKRNLRAIATLWTEIDGVKNPRLRSLGRFTVTALLHGFSKRVKHGNWSFPMSTLSGTLYIPSISREINVFHYLGNKVGKIAAALRTMRVHQGYCVSTQSCTALSNISSSAVDYIFTDPPFGDNLPYAELNFPVEAFLRVFSNVRPEAIVSATQGKGVFEYQGLMRGCFVECYRILKPGRWITVEFHNSRNNIWSAIQESLLSAGFVVADVRVLDKGMLTKKQITGPNSVNKDLVISAYKPNGGLEARFKLEAGTEEGVWDFVRTHFKQLPVFVSKDGQAEIVAERQNYLLFDRMVAFHIQRGVTVPLSAAEFYAGLDQRFSERDGMFFLPEQVAEYDKKRMTVREVLQLQLFVTDESSSIQWLKQQLTKKPQTFQELHPQFLKEIGGWQKHEKPLELSDLLEQNFLRYDGKGEVPNQIHSYLSTNFRELRNLPKDAPELRTKGKDRWYVPDPNKAGDLEKLRERSLLKEFEDYRTSSQKRLKVFRLEAVRSGFKKAWQERDYPTIITVARKIPENVLQEDPKLLMWYDQAQTRTGGI